MKAVLAAAILAVLPVLLGAQPVPAYAPNFACRQMPLGIELPDSYPMLRKIAPIRDETVGETTNWGSYQTVIRNLRFDGLRLVVVTFTNDPYRYVLAQASVTDRRWMPDGPLRIGQTLADVQKKLSAFGISLNQTLTIGGDADTVTVRMADGRVVGLEYACYTG